MKTLLEFEKLVQFAIREEKKAQDLSYVQSKAASLGRGLRLNPKPVSYSWSFLL